MPQITRIIAVAPSIVVIQGAYQEFCTQAAPRPTEYYGAMGPSGPVLTARQQIVLTTDPPVEDWLKFQRLVADWHRERGATSSTTEAVLCPAYQSIVGMGDVAVRFILHQLESEGDDPDQWFWALTAITGASPENEEDRGNYVRMAQSWIEWAENQGYAW